MAPENTLAALKEALRAGVDGVEFDCYLTRDRHVVLLHDKTVARTTDFRKVFGADRSPKIEELTLEELGRLDAGSWKDAKWRGEPVPTFVQALDIAQGMRESRLEQSLIRHYLYLSFRWFVDLFDLFTFLHRRRIY